MTDLSKTIVPKSDQLNADDLIVGSKILKITGVKVVGGDQPVAIHYESDEGKPWKPCKSMRRILIKAWGSDGDAYKGREVEVINDETVKWAGKEVGGIRISAMSHIDAPLKAMITITRGKKEPYLVKVIEAKNKADDVELKGIEEAFLSAKDDAELKKISNDIKANNYDDATRDIVKGYYKKAVERLKTINKGE